jgi:hypothetical protein
MGIANTWEKQPITATKKWRKYYNVKPKNQELSNKSQMIYLEAATSSLMLDYVKKKLI